MAKINPYFRLDGKSEEALNFYKNIFGGEVELQRVKENAMANQMPPEMGEMVFHGTLNAGDIIIMSSDLSDPEHPTVVGSNIAIGVDADSDEQLREWLDKLAADGGKVDWPARDADWGGVFGQCTDKFNVTWMMNYDKSAA